MTIKEFYELAKELTDVEQAELYVVDSNDNYAEVNKSRVTLISDGGILIDSAAKKKNKIYEPAVTWHYTWSGGKK